MDERAIDCLFLYSGQRVRRLMTCACVRQCADAFAGEGELWGLFTSLEDAIEKNKRTVYAQVRDRVAPKTPYHNVNGHSRWLARLINAAAQVPVWLSASVYYSTKVIQVNRFGIEINDEISRANSRLAHCIHGHTLVPCSSFPRDVVNMAQDAYMNHDFSSLPVIADALEEAGHEGFILEHLRGPGPHARGCYALDYVLQKRRLDTKSTRRQQ